MGRIRIGCWGMLIVCFFLPFARGCGALIETPYKTAFKGGWEFLTNGLPFLYPLILGTAYFILFRVIRDERQRLRTAEGFYAAYFFLLSALVYMAFTGSAEEISKSEGVWFWYSVLSILLLFWGTMGFGVRDLSVHRLCRRLAIQASALSLSLITLAYMNYGEKRLIGAWLSLVSSAVIIVTYVVDYLGASTRKPANMQTT